MPCVERPSVAAVAELQPAGGKFNCLPISHRGVTCQPCPWSPHILILRPMQLGYAINPPSRPCHSRTYHNHRDDSLTIERAFFGDGVAQSKKTANAISTRKGFLSIVNKTQKKSEYGVVWKGQEDNRFTLPTNWSSPLFPD